jgi:hypothetical protein
MPVRLRAASRGTLKELLLLIRVQLPLFWQLPGFCPVRIRISLLSRVVLCERMGRTRATARAPISRETRRRAPRKGGATIVRRPPANLPLRGGHTYKLSCWHLRGIGTQKLHNRSRPIKRISWNDCLSDKNPYAQLGVSYTINGVK